MLNQYLPYDYISINNMLPATYKLSPPTDTGSRAAHPQDSTFLHRTSFGLPVRSKSEALIAEILNAENIPFEYERPLRLRENGENVLIHPDFSIPCHGDMIYWEHMGMMSNPKYRSGAAKRFALYSNNGITIPHNLIITMDTVDGGIDVIAIKMIVCTLRTLNGI